MHNKTTLGVPQTIALAEACAEGAQALEVALGILLNTEARLRGDLAALVAAEGAFSAAKALRSTRNQARATESESAAAQIATCMNVLKPRLGHSMNPAWIAAGFADGHLAIPDGQPARLALLGQLRAYFVANPAHEVASLGATAAALLAQTTAFSGAIAQANLADSDARAAHRTRDTALRAMRRRLRGLINELRQLMADDDPRWRTFGLNAPAAVPTPEPVASVIALPGPAPQQATANWPPVAYAGRYRVWSPGPADAAPVLRATTSDRVAVFALPAGMHAITVTALNEAGESLPSAPVNVLVA